MKCLPSMQHRRRSRRQRSCENVPCHSTKKGTPLPTNGGGHGLDWSEIPCTMHHDPSLRPPTPLRPAHLEMWMSNACSRAYTSPPSMKALPINALPQTSISPDDQDTARRFGVWVWDCGPGDQRILRAIVLTDRAHVPTDLASRTARPPGQLGSHDHGDCEPCDCPPGPMPIRPPPHLPPLALLLCLVIAATAKQM